MMLNNSVVTNHSPLLSDVHPLEATRDLRIWKQTDAFQRDGPYYIIVMKYFLLYPQVNNLNMVKEMYSGG